MIHEPGAHWVGRAIRRLEDPTLVRGQGRFTADLPALHYIRFVRSPVASGTVRRISGLEGAQVFTAADLRGVAPLRPMLHKFGYVPIAQPVLADDVVRFAGDPVAVVVAESEERAEDLAEQVEIEIHPFPAVTDAEAALAPGVPEIHPNAPGNIIVDARFDSGAVPGEAPHRIACTIRSRR
jgi:aerobic carbon-monoxide dehydrogenase large subunit